MKWEEELLIEAEIQKMLQKGAIQKVQSPSPNHFLSSIFLVPKSDSGHRPVINLKNLNKYVPYLHFKMETLGLLRELLVKGDFMVKLDLRDAYFSVPLHNLSRKYVSFRWKGKIYEFLCLCFGLGPAPRIFTKLMKIPIALLRRLNVRLIIYLDDCLLMASSIEELLMARDTLVFVLQHLGFSINFEKSVMDPTHNIRFLGVEVNSLDMIVSLPQDKVAKLVAQCQKLLLVPPKGFVEGVNQFVGSPLFFSCGSSASPPSLQGPSEVPDTRVSMSQQLRGISCPDGRSERGVGLVDSELRTFQWAFFNNSPSSVNNSFGCFQGRLGSILQGSGNRGARGHLGRQKCISMFWN
uniref:Reverse transcriptase domain-containing protein n=1 Tax=Clytia hemisphaerica TaxID=252671 RepID=A0A7M6DR42_9CNID